MHNPIQSFKVSNIRRATHSNDSSLRCSFCGKSQEKAGKLISSPREFPRAYICDECVAICAAIIEEDRGEPEVIQAKTHPLASDLRAAIDRWIRDQSLRGDGLLALAEVIKLASQMLSASQEKNT